MRRYVCVCAVVSSQYKKCACRYVHIAGILAARSTNFSRTKATMAGVLTGLYPGRNKEGGRNCVEVWLCVVVVVLGHKPCAVLCAVLVW